MDTADIEKQIKEIEDEIFNTQKNKATEHHIGKLKAKIARLRDLADKRRSQGGKGKGFAVKKTGDATVGLVGFPSVGKSTLLNRLTGADSKIGGYDFTTLETIPGMMKYRGANIQILDLPGMIKGASQGRGRGLEVLSAVRSVDLILFMVDAVKGVQHLDLMADELYNAGLRLNEARPDVVVRKTGHGGINISSTVRLTKLNERVIRSIVSEYLINANIVIREDIDEDQLIDVLVQNRVYVPALVLLNKIDLVKMEVVLRISDEIKKMGWDVVCISSKKGSGLDELKEVIFSKLRLIRVYMKPVGKQADMDEPLILKQGDTVEDACRRLHREFKTSFRYANVSGPSAKHNVQKTGLDHVLEDGDVLTIVTT